jgi:hypothetical protein
MFARSWDRAVASCRAPSLAPAAMERPCVVATLAWFQRSAADPGVAGDAAGDGAGVTDPPLVDGDAARAAPGFR